MITSTRPNTAANTDEIELPHIVFMKQDGNLDETKFVLSDGTYVAIKGDGGHYGKIETFSNQKIYYLKFQTGGRVGELIADPYSLVGSNNDMSSYNNVYGKPYFQYRKVSETIFDSYRRYLQTRDSRYYQGVTKALKDGDM